MLYTFTLLDLHKTDEWIAELPWRKKSAEELRTINTEEWLAERNERAKSRKQISNSVAFMAKKKFND